MANPFANGSAIAAPMSTRPVAPAPAYQPAAQYWNQSYQNLTRDEQQLLAAQERDRMLDLGRSQAGFVLVDRRNEGRGFESQRQRAATWPAAFPAATAQLVEQAIASDQAARNAVQGAIMAYRQWEQQHPTASDELRRLKYEEMTIDPIATAQRAAEQLDLVLIRAGETCDAIDEWQHIESTAEARKAAAERQRQATLDKIDTELLTQRAIVGRLGVKV
jgi:hypothetical protein